MNSQQQTNKIYIYVYQNLKQSNFTFYFILASLVFCGIRGLNIYVRVTSIHTGYIFLNSNFNHNTHKDNLNLFSYTGLDIIISYAPI